MNTPRINAGYTILDSYAIGEQGFAVGENLDLPAPYVTWQYRTQAPKEMFWGHYFADKKGAYEDYHKRIEERLREMEELRHMPPIHPQMCLALNPSNGDLICIKRGEHGYYKSDWNRPGELEHNRRTAELMNAKWGVTPAQRAAMEYGSMFGWDCPAADPRRYDEKGTPLPSRAQRDEPTR